MDFKVIFDKYRRKLLELNLHIYTQSFNEDILLLKWWMLLVETDDLKSLMAPDTHRLSQFLGYFQPPGLFVYSLDGLDRIDFTMWFKDVSSNGKTIWHGNWARGDIRGSRRQLKLTKLVYQMAFEFYNDILITCWQVEKLKLYSKVGYSVTGTMPNYLDQEIVYLLHMDKEGFYDSQVMNLRRN